MKKKSSIIGKIFMVALVAFALWYVLTPGEKEITPEVQAIKARLDSADIYPFYESLSEDDKLTYAVICAAIEQGETKNVYLGQYRETGASLEGGINVNDFIPSIVYEQPSYFWLSSSEITYYYKTKIKGVTDPEVSMKIVPVFTKTKIDEMKKDFDKETKKIVEVAEGIEDTFEKILYVHDSIVKNTQYDHELASEIEQSKFYGDNRIESSAYGCLVKGSTVCNGYTQAFTHVLQQLGILCGVEKNKNHIWNYCELEGEYYYFDLTWDDPSYDEDSKFSEIPVRYEYFAITRDELLLTHEDAENEKTPACDGEKHNYYVRTGSYMKKYSYSKARKVILEQLRKDGYVKLKFANEDETEKAIKDLIDGDKIYDIVDCTGLSYSVSRSGLHIKMMFKYE